MKMEGGHVLIYKGVSGDGRAKEGVGSIMNKTERIISAELK